MPQHDEEPHVERRKLPEIWRSAMWHSKSGLIVSPYNRNLPLVFSGTPSDYHLPRFLSDTNIYEAFYPKCRVDHGTLFSVLAVSNQRISESIVEDKTTDPPCYILNADLVDTWKSLEDPLLDVYRLLLSEHRNYRSFPLVHPPRLPHEFGYCHPHKSSHVANICARKSRDAFRLLSAAVSFALSLWLTEYEDDCLEGAFEMLSNHRVRPVPRAWLQYLQDSVVCNFSPTIRPGGLLCPYNTMWGPALGSFTRAGVPFWLIWGNEDRYKDSNIAESYMLRNYFPPQRFIDIAKKCDLEYTPLVLPRMDIHLFNDPVTGPTYFPSDTCNTPTATTGPSYAFYDTSSAPFDLNPWVASAHTAAHTADTPIASISLDRASINPGSRQLRGEGVGDFFKRMEAALEKHKQIEQPREKQQRLQREAHAANGYPSKRSKVWHWEKDEEDPAFYRRTLLTAAQVDLYWSLYTEYQRRYWSHVHEWDLCPQLPRFPLGMPSASIDTDSDYDSDDETILLISSFKFRASHDSKTASQALKNLHNQFALADGEDEDKHVPTFMDFLDYLRYRHGFFVTEKTEPWSTSSQSADIPNIQTDSITVILKRLLFESQPPKLDPVLTRLLPSFHNTVLSPEDGGRSRYSKLSANWDLSPAAPRDITLVCDQQLLQLQFAKTPKGSTLYILRPPEGSRDNSPWFIATTDATVVLMAYRQQWHTMSTIARGLLELGVPFHTVEERKASSFTPRLPRLLSRGLGFRPQKFVPTADDIFAYNQTKNRILRSALGRSIRLRGGIVGRIAADVVPDVEVINGPVVGDEIVGQCLDYIFVDDYVDHRDLDVVCGVYYVRVQNAGQQISESSYWPKHWIWMTSGLVGDHWTPDAERWFRKRRSEIESGNVSLNTASTWKSVIKFNKASQSRILKGSAFLAADFLVNSTHAQRG